MSGDLSWNKIIGAGLATALVIIGVPQVTNAIFHTEAPEKMGYFVDAPEEVAVVAGAEEAELAPDWGTVLPVADLAAGEAAFARCKSCHSIEAGGANGIGPNLHGVLGGPVMKAAGFAYSDAFQTHKTQAPAWTYDELDQFLTAPARHIPGTKMSFAGIRDSATRINLIAWIRSQGSTGMAMPAPDPSRQPGAAPAGLVEDERALSGTDGAGVDVAPVTGVAGQPAIVESPVAPPASDSPAPPNT